MPAGDSERLFYFDLFEYFSMTFRIFSFQDCNHVLFLVFSVVFFLFGDPLCL